jgi:hypothetical protein
MDKEQATQHALGYASGREDGQNVTTVPAAGAPDGVGWLAYGQAYGIAQDEFNRGVRWSMTNARAAWEAWQATGGVSIFRDPSDRTDAMIARRAAWHS